MLRRAHPPTLDALTRFLPRYRASHHLAFLSNSRLLGESRRRAGSDGQSSRRDGGADRSEAIPRKARDSSFQQFPIYVQRLISLRPGLPR
jgi:hypothetical protein